MDIKYKIISDRKRQDIEMIEMHTEAEEELDETKWKIVQQKYKAKHGKDISIDDLRKRYRIIKDGWIPPEADRSDEEERDAEEDDDDDEKKEEEDDDDDEVEA